MNENLNSSKKTAIIVGILFIVATVSAIISVVFLEPILQDPNYIVRFSENEYKVIVGVLLDILGAGAFVGLAVIIYPILRKHNETIALGYVVARIIEAVPFIIANLSLLSLLTLSKEFIQTPSPEVSLYKPAAAGLIAVYDWAQLLGPRIFASLAALPFYFLLYQSKLLPRWISIWGLIGAPLYLASGFLPLFGLVDPISPILVILFLPAAILEMVLAVWLIVKGFNPTSIASGSANTNN
jgi:hypothetical protein